MDDSEEEMQARVDLEKARAKIKEMERTIKWWSDSTASWREKWGKVKGEKHKYKEESRLLRARNEVMTREINKAKILSQELVNQKEILKMELTRVNVELRRFHNGKQLAIVEPNVANRISDDLRPSEEKLGEELAGSSHENSVYDSTIPKHGEESAFFEQILTRNDTMRLLGREDAISIGTDEAMLLRQTVCESQKRLALKTREYESAMAENLKLTKKVEETEEIRENLNKIKQELAILKPADDVTDGIGQRNHSRVGYLKEMKMKEMRQQVEKLQQENSQEWSLREKLESNNTRLERELKQMTERIQDLEKEVRQKSDMIVNSQSAGMKCLQTELEEKVEQIAELRMTSNRLKKQLQERDDELYHEKKRTGQYNDEIRKLRQRIDDLKRQLVEAEERADNQSNGVRRLQRSLDEQTQQTDNLQVQISYLTQRLKRQSVTSRTVKDLTDGVSDEDEAVEI